MQTNEIFSQGWSHNSCIFHIYYFQVDFDSKISPRYIELVLAPSEPTLSTRRTLEMWMQTLDPRNDVISVSSTKEKLPWRYATLSHKASIMVIEVLFQKKYSVSLTTFL